MPKRCVVGEGNYSPLGQLCYQYPHSTTNPRRIRDGCVGALAPHAYNDSVPDPKCSSRRNRAESIAPESQYGTEPERFGVASAARIGHDGVPPYIQVCLLGLRGLIFMDLSTFHILTGHFPMQGIYLSPQIANDVAPESHIPFCRRIGLPHLNRTRAKTAYGARLWHDSGASIALRNRARVVDICDYAVQK